MKYISLSATLTKQKNQIIICAYSIFLKFINALRKNFYFDSKRGKTTFYFLPTFHILATTRKLLLCEYAQILCIIMCTEQRIYISKKTDSTPLRLPNICPWKMFKLSDGISRQNQSWIWKNCSLFIRTKIEVPNLLTHSL